VLEYSMRRQERFWIILFIYACVNELGYSKKNKFISMFSLLVVSCIPVILCHIKHSSYEVSLQSLQPVRFF
jgi:hypothetical protein